MNASRMLTAASLALSVLAAGPARAAITPEAKAVVDRFVRASGGRAAWEGIHAMHVRGTLQTSGLRGTIEIWRQAPDREASVVAIGPLTIRTWVKGGQAWRSDLSGKPLALDGKDLEGAISNTWFDAQRWLEPDQGGGSVALGAEVRDTLGTLAALEVTPPVGKSRELQFDQRTGLLVRTISKLDQGTAASTSSDFRSVNGWMVVFKAVQAVSGAATNAATIALDSVEVQDRIPDESFSPAATASAADIAWLKAAGVAHIPFDYRGRHLWLRASIDGGPPADFIYDTGASITVIDSAYAAHIGLKSSGAFRAQGGGASGGASFASLDRLRITAPDADGVELSDLKVAVVNVNQGLAPFFWRDCAGIVGFDVIGQFVSRIDFDGRELVLYDPKTFSYQGKGTALPMTLAGTTPVVDIRVDGAYAGAARVDVGSDAMLDLHTPFVKKHGLIASAANSITVTGGGIGGTFQSRLARMKSIEIGPYRLADPLVGLSTTEQGVLASEDYAGNLGNALLDRFTVTIDYQRRQIWLEPGAHYGERRPFSRFGAQLLKFGDELKAAQLLAGGPAASAGLVEGDVVTAIDGKPVSELDPDQLDRQLEEGPPGSKLAITVVRDGKPKKLTVRLKEIL